MYKVSVGIPAYNEEANIKKLLVSLLAQKQENLEIAEIIVVSDASTDNTVAEAESIGDARIRIIKNPDRVGMALSDNEILKNYKGEYLVIVNADVMPVNDQLLESQIQPFQTDPKIGVVGAKVLDLPGKSFFQRTIAYSGIFKQALTQSMHKGSNVYGCSGRARAFSRAFLENFQWAPTVGEDAFSYFSCVSRGFKFKFEPEAQVYFTPPGNFADYSRQANRFEASKTSLTKYFFADLVTSSYYIPRSLILRQGVVYFFRNPILFTSYILIYLSARIFGSGKGVDAVLWEPALSTKKLE